MKVSAARLVEMLRAAGEPTRLRVLALLSHDELAVVELGRILGQSQPRVSRHLKLMADAGLIERFPDGAWVFYRLSAKEPARGFVERILAVAGDEDDGLAQDRLALDAVRRERAGEAAEYFARVAASWDALRSLHVDEGLVEAAIVRAAGAGPFRRMVDLGTGTGRMLTLMGPLTWHAIGLDLSQQMLNLARSHTAQAGLARRCELRHGDICATGLPSGAADLVIIHQVLHFLGDPAAALAEAARLLAPGGRLLVIDFAPHRIEQLRDQHRHRRLGFADEEIARAIDAAELGRAQVEHLPPARAGGLTVVIWSADRAPLAVRDAA